MSANISLKRCHDYQTNLLDDVRDQNTDLLLGTGVGTHSCLLSQLSPLLASLFTTLDRSEVQTLVLPQVEFAIIEKMAQLVYTGRCLIAQSELFKLNHLLNCLDMNTVLDNLSLSTEKVEDLSTVLVNMSISIEKVDDQSIKPSNLIEAELPEVQFVCQVCEKLFGGEDAVSYQEHESQCINKDVEIVPFSFFKDEVNISAEVMSSTKKQPSHECNKNCHEDSTWKDTMSKKMSLVSGRNKELLQANKNEKMMKLSQRKVSPLKDNICKLCSSSLTGRRSAAPASSFLIAHHMFSQHYRKRILNMLSSEQTACDICDKKVANKRSLARHIGETHEIATKLYEVEFSEQLKAQFPTNLIKKAHIDPTVKLDSPSRKTKKRRFDPSCEKKVVCRRIRSSRYHLVPCNEEQAGRTGIVVEVMNIAPVIRDLKLDKVCSGEILQVIEPARLGEPLASSLITRYLVHGSNNLAWKVDEEEYSDCVLEWVKDDRVKYIEEFEDLTVGEKRFFCLWDKFMLDRGYIGSVARVHMISLLHMFVEEIGREVMEGKLYRQFVLHLVQLERQAVLSKGELVRLVSKIRKVGQHHDVKI